MRCPPHLPWPLWNGTRYASAEDHLIVELDRQLVREAHSQPSANFFLTRNSTAALPGVGSATSASIARQITSSRYMAAADLPNPER
jgi:hypothetical protein